MKGIFKVSLLGANFLFSSSFALGQATQEERFATIEAIRTVFNTTYAPKKWKQSANGVFINPIFNYDRWRVNQRPDLSLHALQREIQRSIQDIEDYHVSIRFDSIEYSALPFDVVMVKNGFIPRYFVSYLYLDDSPLSIGDEIVSIDGVPTQLAIKQLWHQLGYQNHKLTDHRLLTQNNFTFRPRGSGFDVPQGQVTIGVIPKGERRKKTVEMEWFYQPEDTANGESLLLTKEISQLAIENPVSTIESSDNLSPSENEPESPSVVDRIKSVEMMFNPHSVDETALYQEDRVANNPYRIGGRKIYTPILGEVIAQAEDTSPFYWYTFTAEDGNTYGYLRLPSYSGGNQDAQAELFGLILNFMEETTDKLVLDQGHNPGGSVLYLYALASMFTDKPLTVPLHQEVVSTLNIEAIEQDIAFFESLDTDEAAKAALGDKIVGYEVTAHWMQDFAQYNRDLLADAQSSKKLTRPLPLIGIPEIAPNQDYHYSKPVLLLTDALCFSGGDFLPAIMQDNDRMTVMGQITAGAGGYVLRMDTDALPAAMGISSLSYTGSLAWRDNGFPIESIGVIPDVFYNPSVTDIKTDYKPYKKAILSELVDL